MLAIASTGMAQETNTKETKVERDNSDKKSTTFFAGSAKYGTTYQYCSYGKDCDDSGWGVGLEFCHIQHNGIGYGLDFHHSRGSRNSEMRGIGPLSEMATSSIDMNYFGPKFIYSTPTNNVVAGRFDVGVGYSHYKESVKDSKGGIGYRVAANLDVRIRKNWGVYAGIEGIHSFYAKRSASELYGLYRDITKTFRLSVSAGIMLTLQ